MRVQVAGIKSAGKHLQTAGFRLYLIAWEKGAKISSQQLGLFQHSLNNVPLSTHFLGNSSEHLLVDTDTLKETCRHMNQTRQIKDCDNTY